MKLESMNMHLDYCYTGNNKEYDKLSLFGIITGAGVSTYSIIPYEEYQSEKYKINDFDLMIFTSEKSKYYYLKTLIPDYIEEFDFIDERDNLIINKDEELNDFDLGAYNITNIADELDLDVFLTKRFMKIEFNKSEIMYIKKINAALDKAIFSSGTESKHEMDLDVFINIVKEKTVIKFKEIGESILKSIIAIFNCLDIEYIRSFDLHKEQFLYNQYESEIVLIDPMIFS